MEKSSGVQSLSRAFGLLEHLSLQPEGMQLMELAQRSGLHKSTVHRLLSALIDLGYVKRTEENGRYALSLKLMELCGRLVEGLDALGTARKALDELRDRVQETVHLVEREGDEVVYVYKAESLDQSYRMGSRIGLRRPMYCTAAGKSILATLPDDAVDAIWRKSSVQAHTPHTIVTLEGLTEELAVIRSRGYALDDEENELGVRCIAAALVDYTGSCRSAFSISAPAYRMPDDRVEELAKQVLEIRRQISSQLGAGGAR